MSKTYRVTGASLTLGHEPGSVFDADLPADQEARMLARGSLAIEPSRRTATASREPAQGDGDKNEQQDDENTPPARLQTTTTSSKET